MRRKMQFIPSASLACIGLEKELPPINSGDISQTLKTLELNLPSSACSLEGTGLPDSFRPGSEMRS